MNTLRILTAGMLLAAAAATATAAEEPSVDTVVVTAKRLVSVPATEAPRDAVQVSVVLPTDMPEAEIDFHLTPVTPPPAPVVARATL
jgi:hypothetical protein